MNIIICDDNEILLAMEEKVCKKYITEEDSLSCYLQSAILKDYLLTEKPDVDLFVLDIEMPEVNGIQLKNLISELYEDTNIVFITGHIDYMKEAFGKKVIGFLSRFEYEEKIGQIIEKIRNDKKNEKIIEVEEGRNVIPYLVE